MIFINRTFNTLLICGLFAFSIQAQFVIDLDPSTPPPMIETTLTVTLGTTGIPVDVYMVSPGPGGIPPFDAVSVDVEFNDVPGVITLMPSNIFDAIGAGFYAGAVIPAMPSTIDMITAGPVLPGIPLTSFLFPPGAPGTSGPFLGSDGGTGFYDVMGPLFAGSTTLPPAGTYILLESLVFDATAIGTTDIATFGMFSPAPLPPGTPPIAAVGGPGVGIPELYDSATGISFFIGSIPSAITVDPPLPVELLTFEAVADGYDAELSWTTASESDNRGFEIQHASAIQPVTWEQVAFVEGNGNSAETQHYNIRVPDLKTGRHLFRLKQLDYDGKSDFSEIVEVSIKASDSYVMDRAYPNPFSNQTQFDLTIKEQQHLQISINDALGRPVRLLFEGELEADQLHTFYFERSDLSAGLYMIHVQGERFSATQSVALSKQ